jgi:ferredoxin
MLLIHIYEKEKRAVLMIGFGIIFNCLFWLVLINYSYVPFLNIINIIIMLFITVFAIISLVSYFPEERKRNLTNIIQYDERNVMFARDDLRFHPKLYSKYYLDKPKIKSIDKLIHNKGSLSDSSKLYYDKYYTPLYNAAFELLDIQREASSINISNTKSEVNKNKLTKTIKHIAKLYGAVDIGITELRDYHIYSHKGRHSKGWGDEVKNDHKWGIAIIVPMHIEMIKKAPTISTIVESSKAYVEAAKVANIIEAYIKKLGYDAKSHTDGNYETLCVPIAVDSGVGELSRMGLIIHKDYGPSVRISIVTTDVELIPTKRKKQHIDSFCRICKKCSDNCPSGAITREDEPESRGFKHWSINQEKCFSFWKNIGTDCGFCLKVCPYTKPNNFFHKMIRFYISRNPLNQRAALFFDNLLMGRKFKIPSKNF